MTISRLKILNMDYGKYNLNSSIDTYSTTHFNITCTFINVRLDYTTYTWRPL